MGISGKFLAVAALAILAGAAPALAELREVSVRPAAVSNRPEGQGVSPTWTLLRKPELVRALRGGGYTIACRHGITDWSQNDRSEAVDRPDERRLQRNLTEAGLAQAREIGAAIRALRIPVATIQSSFYLRTREFAALAFLGILTIDGDLLSRGEPEPRFRAILGALPPPGANAALVTHHNIYYSAGLISSNELEEGGCLIVKPDGARGFAIIAHLAPRDWTELARDFR